MPYEDIFTRTHVDSRNSKHTLLICVLVNRLYVTSVAMIMLQDDCMERYEGTSCGCPSEKRKSKNQLRQWVG